MTNNDCDITQTNIQKISNDIFSTIKSSNELQSSLQLAFTNQMQLSSKISELRDELTTTQLTYDNQLNFGKNQVDDLSNSILMLQNRVTSISSRISLLNANLESLKWNINFINSLNETGQNGGTGSGGSSGGSSGSGATVLNSMPYVTIINHYASNIGMKYSAEKLNTILTTGVDGVPIADAEHIDWINYTLSADRKLTKNDLMARISTQIAKVPANGLYIMFYGGHGGNVGNGPTAKQYLAISASPTDYKVYDWELWAEFKKCLGRVFVIFDCCHAGTMYMLGDSDEEFTEQEIEDENSDLPLPFGLNWVQPPQQNQDSITPRYSVSDPIQGYTGNIASSTTSIWEGVFTNNNPVYVKIQDSNAPKILVYSASAQQGWELGWKNEGGALMTVLNNIWGYHKDYNYETMFNEVYKAHRIKVAEANEKIETGHLATGTALCSFSDGFIPSDYQMFR